MSLVSKLVGLVTDLVDRPKDGAPSGIAEEQLAAAALLVHVARVDGRMDPSERASLTGMLSTQLGLSIASAQRLVERADHLDHEVDDVAVLIDMLGHSLDPDGKGRLVAMAYRVAAADGRVGEFEDDLVWRVGHLLGLGDEVIAAIRGDVLRDGERTGVVE